MSKPLLLLVDDSADMGLIVASLGRRAGWEVSTAPDAEAAWRLLSQRRPDLVLLDVNLPGASGLEWLRRVRAARACAGLQVALYTHWGLPADVAAGLDAGVDFVFDKNLAARPGDWQQRLAEIAQAGRDGKPACGWPKDHRPATMDEEGRTEPSPRAWALALHQAFRHPSLRRLTGEAFASLVRRALTEAIAPRILPHEWDDWIRRDALDLERLPSSFAPGSVERLTACLEEQIRRVLGHEAGSAFGEALAAALPGA